MPRSRSLTRLTMRVALPHLGQSVLLVVSMIFLRSAVFAILAPTAMLGLLISSYLHQIFCAARSASCYSGCLWMECLRNLNLELRGSTVEDCEAASRCSSVLIDFTVRWCRLSCGLAF